MRKKVLKLVISFKSPTDAMAAESTLRPELGRIIPLPARISASCGLAFCTDPLNEREILEILAKNGIEYSDIHIFELYQTSS